MILLDTNVVSEWMKTSMDPAVIAWLHCQQPAHLYLSAVVVADIDTGIALLPDGHKRDRQRLAADTVLPTFEGHCLPALVPARRTSNSPPSARRSAFLHLRDVRERPRSSLDGPSGPP